MKKSSSRLSRMRWTRFCRKRSPPSGKPPNADRPTSLRCAVDRWSVATSWFDRGNAHRGRENSRSDAYQSILTPCLEKESISLRSMIIWQTRCTLDGTNLSHAWPFGGSSANGGSTENGKKAFIVDFARESPHEDQRHLRLVDRRLAYEADMTFGTNSEFGFDYLRDNMAMRLRIVSSVDIITQSWTRSTTS